MPTASSHAISARTTRSTLNTPSNGTNGIKGKTTPTIESAKITPISSTRSIRKATSTITTLNKSTKTMDRLEVPSNGPRDLAANKPTPKSQNGRSKANPSSIFFDRHSAGSPCITKNTPVRSTAIRNSDVSVKVCTPEIYAAVRFETPRKTMDQSNPGVEKSNLVVAVRVRPLTTKEEQEKDMNPVIDIKDNEISILTDSGQTHNFIYDHCFASSNADHHQFANQEKVYSNLAKPLLAKAFEGFNTCLFAYGQTGSRFCWDLFRKIDAHNKKNGEGSLRLQISYFEIYKEKIQDLLSPSKTSLRVREHPQSGPYVVDLSHHAVCSFEEVRRWLLVGNRQRATAATSANERSSRSHAIFTITLAQSHEEKLDGQAHEIRRESRINFIDLAGSERVASVNSTGERREEGLTINQSLLTLGRVITALAEQSFVPYRESVLTWLLKESLGGDSKTVMLATVSPFSGHVEETLSTLRYACQARTIVNTARISEDPNIRLIRNLRQQIEQLQQRAQETDVRVSVEAVVSGGCPSSESNQRVTDLEDEIVKLRERLAEVKHQKETSWKEKVAEAERKRKEAEGILSKYGLSSEIDPHEPCLVNVNQDPLLSGTLIFALKSGTNRIGRTTNSANPPEIQLSGYMIEEQHGCISYADGALTLHAQAEIYVNGQLVNSPVSLRHGDRIIVAGTHFFHLHNPKDTADERRKSPIEVPDYQTAYEELKRVQEERLQLAIEEAQENTRRQLLAEMDELRNEAALEMSLQRHSYEDEIALLNKALEQKAIGMASSPKPTAVPAAKSAIWDDLEAILQDTERRLYQPSQIPQSTFMIQSMINEANAICRRFGAPYTFSRKESLEDGLQAAICVHDRQRHVLMKWSVETMTEKLRILREAVEEDTQHFPADLIFDCGDVWQFEDENFVTPSIREKLDKLQKRHDFSFGAFDESRFSLDSSSRRSSLLPRSPPANPGVITADACRDWIAKPVPDGSLSSIITMSTDLEQLLAAPERSAKFAVGLMYQTHTLMVILPILVDQMIAQREIPKELRQRWTEQSTELRRKMQSSVGHVLQGINLESGGLFSEWIQQTKESSSQLTSLLCELCVVFCIEMPEVEIDSSVAFSSFLAAQIRIHQVVLDSAEEIRTKITLLPEEVSGDSLDMSSSSFSTGWLVKACHDCVAQVQILLERSAATLDKWRASALQQESSDLTSLHRQFHHRIDILLRLESTVHTLLASLESADLNQIKMCVAGLEVQTQNYSQQMDGATVESALSDLSFAVSIVHKIVAQRRRMTALRRGRDITYSPLPARLLASPSSRRQIPPYDDSVESNDSPSPESYDSGEDSMDDLHLSPTVIQRALRFEEPAKSSLKSAENKLPHSRNVRFNVSDSPS